MSKKKRNVNVFKSTLNFFVNWSYAILPLPAVVYASYIYNLPGVSDSGIKNSIQGQFPLFVLVHILIFVILAWCLLRYSKSFIKKAMLVIMLIVVAVSCTISGYMCYVAYGPY